MMRDAVAMELPSTLVHVIDREADSGVHLREWHAAGFLFLVRGKCLPALRKMCRYFCSITSFRRNYCATAMPSLRLDLVSPTIAVKRLIP
jgi:hypothetical protein